MYRAETTLRINGHLAMASSCEESTVEALERSLMLAIEDFERESLRACTTGDDRSVHLQYAGGELAERTVLNDTTDKN